MPRWKDEHERKSLDDAERRSLVLRALAFASRECAKEMTDNPAVRTVLHNVRDALREAMGSPEAVWGIIRESNKHL